MPQTVTHAEFQLPAMGPEEGRPNVISAKGADDFLMKLLPLSMRGKELGKMAEIFGLLRIPMMSISHSDLMPIRSERSDAGLSQCETVIDIRQEFCLLSLS